VGLLIALFCAIDAFLYAREGRTKPAPTPDSRVRVEGLGMLGLIAVVIGAILLRGSWRPGFSFHALGLDFPLQD
ncbi:sodium:proton antiporter, partial [Serratia marcescens]|uniref:sodium:proton antiporter n=1 Tax=Serratia marcescens TaxID=615 RepID=UPI0019533EFC